MPSASKCIDRREFFQQSGTVVGLGAVGSWGTLRDLVLRSQVIQRPVLTEESINTYIQGVRSRGVRSEQAFVTAVRTDVRAFLRGNFTLTPLQDRGITAFTETDISTLANGVSNGLAGRNELKLKLLTPVGTSTRGANCGVIARRETKMLADGARADVWTVTAGTDGPP